MELIFISTLFLNRFFPKKRGKSETNFSVRKMNLFLLLEALSIKPKENEKEIYFMEPILFCIIFLMNFQKQKKRKSDK